MLISVSLFSFVSSVGLLPFSLLLTLFSKLSSWFGVGNLCDLDLIDVYSSIFDVTDII